MRERWGERERGHFTWENLVWFQTKRPTLGQRRHTFVNPTIWFHYLSTTTMDVQYRSNLIFLTTSSIRLKIHFEESNLFAFSRITLSIGMEQCARRLTLCFTTLIKMKWWCNPKVGSTKCGSKSQPLMHLERLNFSI